LLDTNSELESWNATAPPLTVEFDQFEIVSFAVLLKATEPPVILLIDDPDTVMLLDPEPINEPLEMLNRLLPLTESELAVLNATLPPVTLNDEPEVNDVTELSLNVAEPLRTSATVAEAERPDEPVVESEPPLTRMLDPLEVESCDETCNKRLPPVMVSEVVEAVMELESEPTKLPLEIEIELELTVTCALEKIERLPPPTDTTPCAKLVRVFEMLTLPPETLSWLLENVLVTVSLTVTLPLETVMLDEVDERVAALATTTFPDETLTLEDESDTMAAVTTLKLPPLTEIVEAVSDAWWPPSSTEPLEIPTLVWVAVQVVEPTIESEPPAIEIVENVEVRMLLPDSWSPLAVIAKVLWARVRLLIEAAVTRPPLT